MRSVFFAFLMLLTWSSATLACGVFDEDIRYQVEHEIFGAIGEETLHLVCDDDRLIVDRTVDVDVRLMFKSFYRRHARYTEVWQDGRLIGFEGNTVDDGEHWTLTVASVSDERIAIKRAGETIEAPATVIPTDPWHRDIMNRTLLFDRLDGRLITVTIIDAGDDQLKIGGRWLTARKYSLSGHRDQNIWFDSESGFWLKSTIKHASGNIHITRKSLGSIGLTEIAMGHLQIPDQSRRLR